VPDEAFDYVHLVSSVGCTGI